MAAPTIYRWDDDNAPVLHSSYSTEVGMAVKVLKACLVDGYGDKDPVGWSMPFEDLANGTAVFRPASGTRLWLKCTHDQLTYSGYGKILICDTYESMSDINTGINKWNPIHAYGDYGCVGVSSASNNTTPRPWMVIADDKGFYFFAWAGHTSLPSAGDDKCCCGMYFGDFTSIIPGDDQWNCCFSGTHNGWLESSSGVIYAGCKAAATNAYSKLAVSRTSDGELISRATKAQASVGLLGAITGNLNQEIQLGSDDFPDQFPSSSGNTYFCRAFICNDDIISDRVTDVRGFLPGGIYAPCYNKPYDTFDEVVFDGRTLTAFTVGHASNSSYAGQILLDLGENWRDA